MVSLNEIIRKVLGNIYLRYIFLIILLTILIECKKNLQKSYQNIQNNFSVEEYNVYSDLINKLFINDKIKLVVIQEKTDSYFSDESFGKN